MSVLHKEKMKKCVSVRVQVRDVRGCTEDTQRWRRILSAAPHGGKSEKRDDGRAREIEGGRGQLVIPMIWVIWDERRRRSPLEDGCQRKSCADKDGDGEMRERVIKLLVRGGCLHSSRSSRITQTNLACCFSHWSIQRCMLDARGNYQCSVALWPPSSSLKPSRTGGRTRMSCRSLNLPGGRWALWCRWALRCSLSTGFCILSIIHQWADTFLLSAWGSHTHSRLLYSHTGPCGQTDNAAHPEHRVYSVC